MGYYTSYNLNIEGPDEAVVAFHKVIQKDFNKWEERLYGLLLPDYGKDVCPHCNGTGKAYSEITSLKHLKRLHTGEQVKWYSHDKDMIELSQIHPDLVLCLEGEGEESGDIWRKFYKNGKMKEQRAIVTYDESEVDNILKDLSE